MSVDQAYNFRAIDVSVSTAGLLNEGQLSALRAESYETVVNLLPHDSEYAVEREQDIVNGKGIDYIYIPADFAAPTERAYQAFVSTVKACQTKKLLIHCAANYRVPAFYPMYAYEYLGWDAGRTREHIGSIWHPEENPTWDQFISRYIPDKG